MCGRAYSPRFLWMWPASRISVMGGAQASSVLATVKREQLERRGEEWSAEEEAAFKAPIARAVRRPGQPVLLDRAAVGRRHHRPGRHPHRARPRPRRLLANARCRETCLRPVPDVSGMTSTDPPHPHDVPHGARRQPRRDRLPRHPHPRGHGHPLGRRVQRRGPRRQARARGRRRGADRPAAPLASYLNVEAIIAAALSSGAQAIHPGYGFLSENAAFAAGLRRRRHRVHRPRRARPGCDGRQDPRQEPRQLARGPGHPGHRRARPHRRAAHRGRGRHRLPDADQAVGRRRRQGHAGGHRAGPICRRRSTTARRVAAAAFGDDTLFLERLVHNPRHIEVQVLADNHGNVIHLGERECSLQRRHQKVIEEAPSPLLDAATRARIGEAACQAARSVDYVGAGTVEFLVSADAPGRVLLHGDEHPAAGRASGHRDGHRDRPGRVADADRRRRGAHHRPGRRALPRPRGRGAGLRREPGARIPAVDRHDSRAAARPAATASGSTAR